jgi:UDP-N-acetylmuramyl pentapeptide phosphotransferase/UDP-N-acetylglucosamine-1-phosphate transferase
VLLIFSPIIFYFWDFWGLLEKRFLIFLIIWIGISCISFLDDLDTIWKWIFAIPPIFRLLMQIGVGIIIGLTSIKISYISHIYGGILKLDDIFFQFSLFDWTITVYIFPLLITVFWYVLVFNSVNFSDGVPGMAGGFAGITFCILWLLAFKLYITDTSLASQENSRFILTLLAIIIPATFFLTRADITRRVIMGDSGTIMLAFCIATFSIIAGGKIATAMSVLGIYLIDLVYVVMTRILQWKNPMKWEQSTHLHFRLMELWLSASEIRTIVYTLAGIFGFSAIFLPTSWKIILFIFITIVTLFLTEILSLVKKK